MNIGIIGASGLVGNELIKRLKKEGHEPIAFSRQPRESSDFEWRLWQKEQTNLSGLDAIVNLSGETVAQRWTQEVKEKLHTSRIEVTRDLVQALRQLPVAARPHTLVNASAIGYYGDGGDRELSEACPAGGDFLAKLCVDWERAAFLAEEEGLRVVVARIGMVLSAEAEAWKKLSRPFRLGIGGKIGSGKQWMPWVHLDDVVGGILFSIQQRELRGPVNLVSPDAQRNDEFTSLLAKTLRRPALMTVPAGFLKLALGGFAEALLASYRVVPQVLMSAGYEFTYPKLEKTFQKLSG